MLEAHRVGDLADGQLMDGYLLGHRSVTRYGEHSITNGQPLDAVAYR